MGDPVACLPKRRSAPYKTAVRKGQLGIWYVSNERVMPNRDRRIFGLPCRFPAKPEIFAVCAGQAYDCTGFFSMREAAKKNFSRVFPVRQGTEVMVRDMIPAKSFRCRPR